MKQNYNSIEEKYQELIQTIIPYLINHIDTERKHIQRIQLDKTLLQLLLPNLLKDYCEYLKFIDLSGISFDGQDLRRKNLKETNMEFDPQTIYLQSLYQTNLQGVDLSQACLDHVELIGANLERTKAKIFVPKLRYYKGKRNREPFLYQCLWGTNLNGCYIIGDLASVEKDSHTKIEHAIFLNTEEELGKQYIKNR